MNGRAALQSVLRRLGPGPGWPAGLTVLTGDDMFHLDAAQKAIVAHLVPPGGESFGLRVFGADPIDAGEIVAAARSMGMFSPRRVVLVRDVGQVALESDRKIEAACAAFTAYAQAPPPGSFLLVRAPKLDMRRHFHKVLSAAPHALTFTTASGDPGLVDEVRQMAQASGLTLDPEAAAFLVDTCAEDLYRVSSELDKLRLWIGGNEAAAVSLDTLREVVSGGASVSNWHVADALSVRDRKTAMDLARRVLDEGEEPLVLLGALAWRARAMLQAKAMLAAGAGAGEVQRVARFYKVPALSRWSLEELLAFPARLLQADKALKSRSIGGRAVLESLLEDLTR